MMLRPRSSLLLIALALGACGDENTNDDVDLRGFGGDLPGFAVHSTDDTYTSASIGFLRVDGSPLDQSWLHSGTQSPKLVEALGSDVALVTEERGDGTFTVLSRFGTDVVSRFDLVTGDVLGQALVRENFAVNPYDVVYTDSGRAFVLRYGSNLNAGASALEQGDDLLEIDPETGEILGLDPATGAIAEGRIDLREFHTAVVVLDEEGEEIELTAGANPASALEVNGQLVIGLARFTPGFETAAPGAIVIHDLATTTSRLVDLSPLRDCERVTRGRAPNSFVVLCQGFWDATEPDQGMVVFELDEEGELNELGAFRVSDHPELPNVVGNAILLDDTHFFGVAMGAWGDAASPDVGYLVSLTDGIVEEVFESTQGAALSGRMAFDVEDGLLLVPDSAQGVHRFRFDRTASALEHIDTFSFGLAGMRVRGIVDVR